MMAAHDDGVVPSSAQGGGGSSSSKWMALILTPFSSAVWTSCQMGEKKGKVMTEHARTILSHVMSAGYLVLPLMRGLWRANGSSSDACRHSQADVWNHTSSSLRPAPSLLSSAGAAAPSWAVAAATLALCPSPPPAAAAAAAA
jgi:hypothetical protein